MSAVVQLPGLAREAQITAAALEILERRHARGAALTDPDATRAYLRVRLAERPNEVFGVIYLDNRHRVIACEELFTGTIDGTAVHPRVVAQRAPSTQRRSSSFTTTRATRPSRAARMRF